MKDLIDQIEVSLGTRLYFLSLFAALTVPDIAGALEAPNGEATSERYEDWYEQWVRPRFAEDVRQLAARHGGTREIDIENPLTGKACYRFRCSLLHQGRSQQHPESPYSRILFIEPGSTGSVVRYGRSGDALIIDLRSFCGEMIRGARLWLREVEGTEPYKSNYERFARRHERGLAPHILGVPVIG